MNPVVIYSTKGGNTEKVALELLLILIFIISLTMIGISGILVMAGYDKPILN